MSSNNKNKNKKSVSVAMRGVKSSIKGRGDYNVSSNEFTQLQSKLDRIESKMPDIKSGFSKVGSKLGGLVGMSDLGRSAGEGMSKLLGFGDYEIVSNSLMKSVGGQMVVPKFDNKGTNGIRVREREFLGDVVSGPAGTFKNTSFYITPNNAACFPWLSKLSVQFDQWEPNGIVFEFVSTSSDFNGSAQGLGSIIMATDYDALDAPYPNKIVMDNADYASSQKPSCNQIHGVECDPAQRPYKVMYNRSVDSDVANRNTLGNFQIASAGVSANTVTLGELWISYDITLYKKQLDANSQIYTLVNGTSTGNIFTGFTVAKNVSGFSWKQDANPAILYCYFPPGITKGRYQILYFVSFADLAPNFVVYQDANGATKAFISSRLSVPTTGQTCLSEFLVEYAPGDRVVFVAQNATVTPYLFSVKQVPDDYTY
jgi:hypothetical protein